MRKTIKILGLIAGFFAFAIVNSTCGARSEKTVEKPEPAVTVSQTPLSSPTLTQAIANKDDSLNNHEKREKSESKENRRADSNDRGNTAQAKERPKQNERDERSEHGSNRDDDNDQ